MRLDLVKHIICLSAILISSNVLNAQSIDTTDYSNWKVDSLIIECPEGYREALIQDLQYTQDHWRGTENPMTATFTGVDFGDYFHIDFEDSTGKSFDFGFGNNDFGKYELIDDTDQMIENKEYFNKQFKIYWEWKISEFPCCSGEYELVKAYQPSIVGLELVDGE